MIEWAKLEEGDEFKLDENFFYWCVDGDQFIMRDGEMFLIRDCEIYRQAPATLH